MNTEHTELDALGVFSHPDDAELTVAGTLLKLKSLGYRTGVLDMTRGEMGTRGTPEGRAEEANAAARILKLDVRLNLEQPDGHVWLTEDSRRAMVRVFRTHRPKIVFTQHWDDPHPDHAATCRIVREAARLATMRRYDEESGQRAIQMPALAHTVYSRLVVPSFIVDVSDFVEAKMDAIRAHTSQFLPSRIGRAADAHQRRGLSQPDRISDALLRLADRRRGGRSLLCSRSPQRRRPRRPAHTSDEHLLVSRDEQTARPDAAENQKARKQQSCFRAF